MSVNKEIIMDRNKLNVTVSILLAAALLIGPVSCAHKASHDEHHTDHAATAAVPASDTYADAIKQIRSRMASINSIIASGNYDTVHDDAEAIGQACGLLEKLAAAPGSGVPREKVPAVA